MFKMKKMKWQRALALMLLMFSLLTVFAFAENATTDTSAQETAAEAPVSEYIPNEYISAEELEAGVLALQQSSGDPDISILDAIKNVALNTGLAKSFNPESVDDGDWRSYVMIAVACLLLYLAIVKQFEPLLLLPIAFGMLLANLPGGRLGAHSDPVFTYYATLKEAAIQAEYLGKSASDIIMRFNPDKGMMQYSLQTANGGLIYYLYHGVKWGIFPPIIFMGVGAMTDFGPLLANPKSLLLGAAAQLGIFLTFIGAKAMGFTAQQAGSIGIIGGADGPTAIFVTTKLAPQLLGPIAVAAYSYMALVPVIQPPIMNLLTTKKERTIRMGSLRAVTKTETIIFPIMVTIIVSLLLPDAATLIGCLMFGNLLRVSGVTERLSKTVQNELCNIVTLMLGLSVGATTTASQFLTLQTIEIVILGVIAFGCGTAGGVLLAKLMNVLAGGTINPLIGSAGVSAVPMAARVSNKEGQKNDPGNFLLMHAMGPNVAGVIGSAVAAGVFIALFA